MAESLEVTPTDMEGTSKYKVVVKDGVNPALVGYFKCADDAKFPFAYGLIKKDGEYTMFVKIDKKYEGFIGATLEGNVIYFGKDGHAKITFSEEGIFRTFKGKAKTFVERVE